MFLSYESFKDPEFKLPVVLCIDFLVSGSEYEFSQSLKKQENILIWKLYEFTREWVWFLFYFVMQRSAFHKIRWNKPLIWQSQFSWHYWFRKLKTVMEAYWLQLGIVKLEVRKNESVLGEESFSNWIFLNILSWIEYKLLVSCYFCTFSFLDYLYGTVLKRPESHFKVNYVIFCVAFIKQKIFIFFCETFHDYKLRAKSYLDVLKKYFQFFLYNNYI